MEFKMRQHQQQRKITPHYQEFNDGESATDGGVEWEEFEIENIVNVEERITHNSNARHENGFKDDGEIKEKKSK